MSEKIKLIQPYISYEEVNAELQDIFSSGQFTKGLHVEKFVNSLARYCSSEYAFLTTSATTALWACLKAVGVGVGDRVAVSDFSFPATANVVEDLGAIPVFVDVSLDTFNMQLLDLEVKIKNGVKAVIFVDALGNPSGLLDIKELCTRYNIPLIEDAACAIGSRIGSLKVGSIADLTCFSFHPRKLLTTGEGGAILTSNLEYAEWFRKKLNHGASGFKGKGLDFVDFGYNFRLSEIQALMGWKQLIKLDSIVNERNHIANLYNEHLIKFGFSRQSYDKNVIHNVQSLVYKVPYGVCRDSLIEHLSNNQIETTIGTYCQSGGTYYKKKYNDVQPNSRWLEDNTITLPCYRDVNIGLVIEKIQNFL